MFLFLAVHSLYIPCVGHRGGLSSSSLPGDRRGKGGGGGGIEWQGEVPKKEVFRQEEKAARTARVQKEEEKCTSVPPLESIVVVLKPSSGGQVENKQKTKIRKRNS